MNYSEKFWNKFDFLHKRFKEQYTYTTNFLEILKKLQSAFYNFSKILYNILSKDLPLFDKEKEKENSLNKTLQKFINNLTIQCNESSEISDYIKLKLIEPLDKEIEDQYIKEKNYYNELKKSLNSLNSYKNNLNETKIKFYKQAKIAEDLTFSTNKIKLENMILDKEDFQKNEEHYKKNLIIAKQFEDDYIKILNETNKLRKQTNNKQKNLLDFYQQNDINLFQEIKQIISFYIAGIKKFNSSSLVDIDNVTDKYKLIDIKDDINNFMKINFYLEKPESEIKFEPYQSNFNVDSNENYELNYKVICSLKNYLNVFPNFNIEEENIKLRLRKLCSRVFKIGPNVNFSEEEKSELLTLIKKKEFRNIFLISLSKQRTKGRFNRSEKLLNDLKDILLYILDISEKELDYESAKNCIILSQTFYTEKNNKNNNNDSNVNNSNNNNNKIYLFESICNNKWLKSFEFWKGIINYMIIQEIYKNEEIVKFSSMNEKKEEKIIRYSNIAFSQLLSYTNNMMEFKINKSLIIFIIDDFVKQYQINEKLSEPIYGLVCEKEEIEILREKGKILVQEMEKNNENNNNKINENENGQKEKKSLNDNDDKKKEDIKNNNEKNINNIIVNYINNNENENNNKINEENNINNNNNEEKKDVNNKKE